MLSHFLAIFALKVKALFMENFKIGEVVILRSGGPKLTVSAINTDQTLVCCWFDKNEILHYANFVSIVLKKNRELV